MSPDEYDAHFVERVLDHLTRVFGPDGWFPVEAIGWDNVPPAPVLVVSNHSGGSTIIDAWGFGYAWYQHFHFRRVLHVLAHEMLMATRVSGPILSRVGVLRATRGRARQVLEDWKRDLWVMPGGDRDTWRPFRERYRLRFCGHMGYARLALRTRTPVLPVANAGAHETLVILTDGRRIAKRLNLHELFRIDVFPIHLSLPWIVGIGPWPHIPFPARLRYRVGAPVELPHDLEPDREPTMLQVQIYDRRVRAALQALLDTLAAETKGRPSRRPRQAAYTSR